MGLRFHKSFQILPGVKLNINKKSVGVTLGTKGAHYTINSKGKRTASVGIPGTGLSYSTSTSGKGKQKDSAKNKVNSLIRIGIAVIVIVCVVIAVKSHFDDKNAAAANTQTAITTETAADTALKTNGASASAADDTVWVSDSGSKYHSKADCSGMEDATAVTLTEAQEDGKTACKRCY